MRFIISILTVSCLLAISGCFLQSSDERNPFLTATEEYGSSIFDGDDSSSSSGMTVDDDTFRQTMTVTLANSHPTAELNTSFVAWVSPSSIRSGEQQDALLASGYIQLDSEVELGSVLTLVAGTFVYSGGGVAGATTVRLSPTRAADNAVDPTLATTAVYEMVTPDGVLVFSEPPVSCESVAFYFTIDGDPLTSEGITGVGNIYAGATSNASGIKTLAQISTYECDPFNPGMFLRIGGGALPSNEYFEGQDLRYDFSPIGTADGDYCTVTLTAP